MGHDSATRTNERRETGKEKAMHAEQKLADANLTRARQWLNVYLRRQDLTEAERSRRVAEYARQVERWGRILAWLAPADERDLVRRPRASRFAYGDALGRHLAACAG